MARIHDIIGVESGLEVAVEALQEFSGELNAPIVGAFHVTCCDETEGQCAEVFQRSFVEGLLPELKPDCRWPFRAANLGARYEQGAIGVAEDHFAIDPDATKLMVVKINAHVGVLGTADGPQYGRIKRYGHQSSSCGALAGLLAGGSLPAMNDIRDALCYDGKDRVAMLCDESLIDPRHRALFAAITNARLQARAAVEDIRANRPKSPTIFLVMPTVTFNRGDADTELVVGQYGIDFTEEAPTVKYDGLGDDPSDYRLSHDDGGAKVEDASWPAE